MKHFGTKNFRRCKDGHVIITSYRSKDKDGDGHLHGRAVHALNVAHARVAARESLAARGARIRLRARVPAHVRLRAVLGRERLAAHIAPARL